jgi:hypothetical protein
MAVTFPYATTVNGLNATVTQLRNAFPAKVNAETLKRLGIAPGNESSILQTLRFVRLINDEGDKQPDAAKVFVEHDSAKFAAAFEPLVRAAYASLFETLGDGAWTAGRDQLITFFRQADQTSARVGEQQAATFLALAAFAGHGEAPATSGNGSKRATPAAPRRPRERAVEKPSTSTVVMPAPVTTGSALNVTVRIELNIPAVNDQEIYDKLFRSIRENLVNA